MKPDGINAETSAPDNYLITITFNTNNLDRPALSIARTFIHEMIHAEIFRKLLSVAQAPNITLTQSQVIQLRNDYPGLYDYYMRWNWNIPQGQSPSNAQHEAMSTHYRGIIEQALRDFDNTQSDAVYEALAWTGLMGDGTFDNTIFYTGKRADWRFKGKEFKVKNFEEFIEMQQNLNSAGLWLKADSILIDTRYINLDLFRIDHLPFGKGHFVSETLKEEIENRGFTGISFIPIEEFHKKIKIIS